MKKERYNPEVWDSIFDKSDWGRYPSEELIRFVMSHYKHIRERSRVKILDLGCAEGANLRFLKKEGFSSVGIDGSWVALQKNRAISGAKNLRIPLVCADFAKLPMKTSIYDCVVEVASLQHNDYRNVIAIVDNVYALLKEDGIFFSMCLQVGSHGYGLGKKIEENTFFNINAPLCKSKGNTHFFSKEELLLVFKKFNKVSIDKVDRTLQNGQFEWKSWIVTAQK